MTKLTVKIPEIPEGLIGQALIEIIAKRARTNMQIQILEDKMAKTVAKIHKLRDRETKLQELEIAYTKYMEGGKI
jgi:hypothetical protein